MTSLQSQARQVFRTRSPEAAPEVGFIGLGLMGSAMVTNLVQSTPLTVWNRSQAPTAALGQLGAHVATTSAEVFATCRVVFLMLSDEAAIDAVLPRDGSVDLQDRIIVLMSTVAPAFSRTLAEEIKRRGGAYVEAPVSGSRQPAVDAKLIAMVAGEDSVLDTVEPHLRAMCQTVVRCGQAPAALTMKLAVNTFLISVVTGLAESFHFAEENGLDVDLLRDILDVGPMASAVSRAKSEKLAHSDWTPQAAIPDVLKNCRLIVDQARQAGTATPLMETCTVLFAEAATSGHDHEDMVAVVSAMRHRTYHEKTAGRHESDLGR